MEHSRSKFDVLERIMQERLTRGWSEYTLAKNSGIPQSTISTWYRKKLQPSISSIEKICEGFDITLSQFFTYENQNNTLTSRQQDILELWSYLNENQKEKISEMIKAFIEIPKNL